MSIGGVGNAKTSQPLRPQQPRSAAPEQPVSRGRNKDTAQGSRSLHNRTVWCTQLRLLHGDFVRDLRLLIEHVPQRRQRGR